MIKINAVGDISLGDSAKTLGFGVKSKILDSNDNGCFLFANIQDYLSGDIVFGNLETVLSNKGLITHDHASEHLRGLPGSIQLLKEAGFNVINIANNHAMQHGIEAFEETVELLLQNNIAVVGLRDTTKYYSKPSILTVRNQTIGFLGYAFEKDIYNYDGKLPYAFYGNLNNILSDVKKLSQKVDFVVVSCHWGLEFIDRPSATTISLARDIIDVGGNLIIGHHPHVLQGIECYKEGIICYSLGNFICDMSWDARYRESMIFNCVLNGKTTAFNTVPVTINTDYQPVVYKNKSDLFENQIKQLSLKIQQEVEGNVEKNNLSYYLEYESLRQKDSKASNILLIKTLFKTPISFMPGKIRYILGKISTLCHNICLL